MEVAEVRIAISPQDAQCSRDVRRPVPGWRREQQWTCDHVGRVNRSRTDEPASSAAGADRKNGEQMGVCIPSVESPC